MVGAGKKVVVGYDGSGESEAALKWAAAVANRRRVPLLVLHATGVEKAGDDAHLTGAELESVREAQELAERGAAVARGLTDAEVEAVGVEKNGAAALVDYSKEAGLVVVGNRGRGRLRGALLGSVAFAVTTHAKCPVAVVRGSLRPLPSAEDPIVVGIDGSPGSQEALDEAAILAASTGATLRITVAYATQSNFWTTSYIHHTEGEQPTADAENLWSRRAYDHGGERTAGVTEKAKQVASDIARAGAERVAEQYPGVSVAEMVAAGRAEEVIVDAAADASLIVVGARGRGDFASLLLGSVSREVIQRADCAVYVIR